MECQECLDSLTALLDGELSAKEETRVGRHLEVCAPCASECDSFRQVGILLEQTSTLSLPETMWSSIRTEIAPAPTSPRPSPQSKPRWTWRWSPVGAVVLAGVAGAVFFWPESEDLELRQRFDAFIAQRKQLELRHTPSSVRHLVPLSANPFREPAFSTGSNPFAE